MQDFGGETTRKYTHTDKMATLKPLLLHFLLLLIIFLLILLLFPELLFFRKESELEITNFRSLQGLTKIRQNLPTDFPVKAYELSDSHEHPYFLSFIFTGTLSIVTIQNTTQLF